MPTPQLISIFIPLPKIFGLGLIAAVAVIGGVLPACPVIAWQTPAEEVVVLNNRQTFTGRLTRHPDKITVSLPSGTQIVFPKTNVMFAAPTLAAAYWELAARTRSTDTQGQIEVFKWCVGNHQFEEAANHLLMLQEMPIAAKTLMQLDVSLEITQKRFRQSQSQSQSKAQASLASQSSDGLKNRLPGTQHQAMPIDGLQSVDAITIPNLKVGSRTAASPGGLPLKVKCLPSLQRQRSTNVAVNIGAVAIDQYGNEVDSAVQQVSFDQPIGVTEDVPLEDGRFGSAYDQSDRETGGSHRLPAIDSQLKQRLKLTQSLVYSDLDKLTRSMPKGSIGLFRKQVEPMLQRACGQCHRSGGNQYDSGTAFEIYQAINGSINRRMSQKNLYQALNLSDPRRPDQGLLVRYATTAHGDQSSASFDLSDSKMLPLKRWLIMVSENPFLPVNEFAEHRGLLDRMPKGVSANSANSANADGPAGSVFKAQSVATSVEETIPEIPASKSTAGVRGLSGVRGSTGVSDPVLDPFDGEIFNQKFLP